MKIQNINFKVGQMLALSYPTRHSVFNGKNVVFVVTNVTEERVYFKGISDEGVFMEEFSTKWSALKSPDSEAEVLWVLDTPNYFVDNTLFKI